MSRALGRGERAILGALESAKGAYSAKGLTAVVYATAEPTVSQYAVVRQALSNLRRKGLAVSPGRGAAWGLAGKRLRIQSRNRYYDGFDDLDPYFTRPEAVHALLCLEPERVRICNCRPCQRRTD